MSKPSAQKVERQKKKQQKKERNERLYEQRLEIFNRFPEIIYAGDAPQPLMEIV